MNNGIYKIRNIINNHCYIGSCSHFKGFIFKWRTHKKGGSVWERN